jgi:hypothetical protein
MQIIDFLKSHKEEMRRRFGVKKSVFSEASLEEMRMKIPISTLRLKWRIVGFLEISR